jgi:hypothetical protein
MIASFGLMVFEGSMHSPLMQVPILRPWAGGQLLSPPHTNARHIATGVSDAGAAPGHTATRYPVRSSRNGSSPLDESKCVSAMTSPSLRRAVNLRPSVSSRPIASARAHEIRNQPVATTDIELTIAMSAGLPVKGETTPS